MKLPLLGAALAGAFLLTVPVWAQPVAVDSALPDYAPAAGLSGAFTATGDDDMESVMHRWVAIYRQAQPGVKVTLDIGTSATAPGTLASGKAELAFVGRTFLDREEALVTRAWGRPPFPIVVSGGTFDDREKTHAELVWVNPANPLRQITLTQLAAIFGGHAQHWGDLGVTGDWAARPIRALRNSSIGASEFFRHVVLRGGAWGPDIERLAKPDDIPLAVAADPQAIGLAGEGFAAGQKVRSLAVGATEDSCAAPTLENVANRSYPLAREIFMYVRRGPDGGIDPKIADFLRAVLSRSGQEAALADGYMPLSNGLLQAERAKLK